MKIPLGHFHFISIEIYPVEYTLSFNKTQRLQDTLYKVTFSYYKEETIPSQNTFRNMKFMGDGNSKKDVNAK